MVRSPHIIASEGHLGRAGAVGIKKGGRGRDHESNFHGSGYAAWKRSMCVFLKWLDCWDNAVCRALGKWT
jgi:hypothetical protein